MEIALDQLVVQARAGDAESADRLLRRLVPAGYRLAFAFLHDQHDAEDVVQNACIKAWRKLDRVRDETDPKPWFLGIVANECRSLRRSRWAATVTGAGLVEPTVAQSPSRDTDGDAVVRSTLAALSKDDRLVLILRFYLDMSAEQTSRILHISPAGVRSRSHRASARLRAAIDALEGEPYGR